MAVISLPQGLGLHFDNFGNNFDINDFHHLLGIPVE